MSLPRVRASGLLFAADPHVADTPPGQRLPGYREQVLDKLAAWLGLARELDALPVLLGDLFHWPRENSNALLVALMRLFTPQRPFVLVGNHDKHLARLTSDVSLSVLAEAGAVRLLDEPGPAFVLETPGGEALIGASPDGSPLPARFERAPGDPGTVVWLTHHNIRFPEFEARAHGIHELPGIDLVVNGHIHRPQPDVRAGTTLWVNPGNTTRLTFTRRSQERRPAVFFWAPGRDGLERRELPFLPFEQVFPDQEFPPEEQETEGESRFIQGLERLAWRRTGEGTGLKQFLQANLNPELPESALVWELYEEVVHGSEAE
ncbi:MAG: metallophosphoesterase [Desulfovibrionaceae bacterium]|nr:metallophosphoesterase [Desulfovibrionaceae bacterium]